jgi:hypothetical protein
MFYEDVVCPYPKIAKEKRVGSVCPNCSHYERFMREMDAEDERIMDEIDREREELERLSRIPK